MSGGGRLRQPSHGQSFFAASRRLPLFPSFPLLLVTPSTSPIRQPSSGTTMGSDWPQQRACATCLLKVSIPRGTDRGNLVLVSSLPHQPVQVTLDHPEAFVDCLLAHVPPGQPQRRRGTPDKSYPCFLPALGRYSLSGGSSRTLSDFTKATLCNFKSLVHRGTLCVHEADRADVAGLLRLSTVSILRSPWSSL